MTPRTDQPYRQETTAYAVMSAKGTPIFLADTLAVQ